MRELGVVEALLVVGIGVVEARHPLLEVGPRVRRIGHVTAPEALGYPELGRVEAAQSVVAAGVDVLILRERPEELLALCGRAVQRFAGQQSRERVRDVGREEVDGVLVADSCSSSRYCRGTGFMLKSVVES